MAVCEMHLGASHALGKMTSFTALVPEGQPGPFPVLYLLHGLGDDHTGWTRRTSLERYVEGLPLIVVMPNGERGFYTDSVSDPMAAFEANLLQDVIGFVDRTWRTIPTREGRAIAGLSMGGYGALKLALKRPGLFCAAVSHSGAVAFASRPLLTQSDWHRDWVPVFGPDPSGGPEDIFALAENSDPATRPALRIDCGVDDFLLNDNRALHTHLDRLDFPHEYAEWEGGHGWDYWDLHIPETLTFCADALGIQRS